MQVTCGFTTCFKRHEKSASHQEAVKVVMTIPSTTKDIGEQLSQQYSLEKANNREALHQILRCILLLCRQGLPLRGDEEEVDGNLK